MSFHSSVFTLDFLETVQGYSLQAFASGRFKLSFQTPSKSRAEYYGVVPKRDREAYQRQRLRSLESSSDHFFLVDSILLERPSARIYRLHEKTNSNDTADNAHILLDIDQHEACVVLGDVLHVWSLPPEVVADVIRAQGARSGEASVFNEYLLTYEHGWTPYKLTLED